MNTCGPLVTGRCPEQLHVPGADFTNSFYLLSSFPAGPESRDLDEFLSALTAQCASLEELRLAFRPQMDPRWVLGSCFPSICFRKGRNGGTFRTKPLGGCWRQSAQAAAPLPGVGRTVRPWLCGPEALWSEDRMEMLTQERGGQVAQAGARWALLWGGSPGRAWVWARRLQPDRAFCAIVSRPEGAAQNPSPACPVPCQTGI